MNDEAAPWRALEDGPAAPDGEGRQAGAAGNAPSGGRPAARLTWPWVAITAAALVAGVAGWLIVSSGHGSFTVEGAAEGPGASGRGIAVAIGPAPSSGVGVVVDVQGAVVRPGIVRLPPGSRVADAIAAAGGYGPRVAADRIGQTLNLAALLKDGDQVIVPSRDDRRESPPPRSGGTGATGNGSSGTAGPVDLNRATATELDALPGIGPVTAAKIVAARGEKPFASVDELKSRKVLGAATFDKVKDLVVVR